MDISVAMAGYAYKATSASGLHFEAYDGETRVAYSNATWIDAHGVSTKISAEYSDGTIRITVPDYLLSHSAYPAILDPTAGPEYDVDTPILEPAEDAQQAPVIASSRGDSPFDYLVVWQDRRRSLNLTYDIFGTYISSSGVLQTQVGFLISGESFSTTDETSPTVAYSPAANTFAVAYVNNSAGTPVIGGASLQCTHSGSGGTCATSSLSYAQISTPSVAASTPQIADLDWPIGGTTGYVFATWTENSQVVARVFTPAFGIIAGDPLQPISNDSGHLFQNPVVACSSNDPPANQLGPFCMIAFASNRGPGGTWQIEGTELDSNGAAGVYTDNSGNTVTSFLIGNASVGGTAKSCTRPAIAPFPGHFQPWLVAFQCNMGTFSNPNFDVFAEMVYDDAGVGTPPPPTPPVYPNDGVHNNVPVPMSIATGTGQQTMPAVGYGNLNNAMITWSDNNGTGNNLIYRVKAQRYAFNACGGGAGPCNFSPVGGQISVGGSPSNSTANSVVSNGSSQYVTVWSDNINNGLQDIYGAFVSMSSGAVQWSQLLSVSSNQETAGVISKCGSAMMVAWADSRNNADTDIYGQILTSTGVPQGGSFLVGGGIGDQDQPAIGCDGTNFLVTWTDRRNSNPNIYYNVVTQSGTVTYAGGHALTSGVETDIESAIAYQPAPSSWWVVWSFNSGEIRAQRIDTGTKLPIGTAVVVNSTAKSGYTENPDIDYDSSNNNLLVVWQAPKNTSPSDLDIYGARLSVSGVAGSLFAINSSSVMTMNPRVRFLSGSHVATVIYERYDGSTNVIMAQPVSTAPGSPVPVAVTVQNSHPRITNRDARTQELVYYTSDPTDQFNYNSYGWSLVDNAPSGSAYNVSVQQFIREMTPDIACVSGTQCVSVFRQFDNNDVSKIDRIKATMISY